MKRKRFESMALVLAFAAGLSGCWIENFDDPEDYDEIVSVYKPGYDFSKNSTYAMPERIYDLSARVEDSLPLDFDHEDVILREIADQMAELGYDRIADPRSEEADVVLVVGAVIQEEWAYGYYYYDYYYYYYPPVYVEWETGTVLIAMLNPKDADAVRGDVPVVWAAGLRGFVDYYREDGEIRSAVAQAFEQSPYLEVGKPVQSEPGLEAPDAGDDSDTGGEQ